MYSREIVAKRLFAAQKAGLTCKRLPRERSIEIARNLELLRYDARGTLLPAGVLAGAVIEAVGFLLFGRQREAARVAGAAFLHYVEVAAPVGYGMADRALTCVGFGAVGF